MYKEFYTQTRIKLNRHSLSFLFSHPHTCTAYTFSSERSSFSGISFHLFFISGEIRPRCKLRLERRPTQGLSRNAKQKVREARGRRRARRGMVGYSNDRITCTVKKEIARRETRERVNLSSFSLFILLSHSLITTENTLYSAV